MTDEQMRIECEPVPFSMVPKWITLHATLSVGARALYAVLLHYATMPQGAITTHKRLGEDLGGKSKSSVKRWMDELIQEKAVERKERYRENGGQTSNLYTLMVTPPGSPVNHPPAHRRTAPRFTREPHIKTEVNENEITTPQTPQRGAAASPGGGVESALIEAGVTSAKHRRRLCALEGITPGIVRAVQEQAAYAGWRGGLIITKIEGAVEEAAALKREAAARDEQSRRFRMDNARHDVEMARAAAAGDKYAQAYCDHNAPQIQRSRELLEAAKCPALV